jgi:hypothetical protein
VGQGGRVEATGRERASIHRPALYVRWEQGGSHRCSHSHRPALYIRWEQGGSHRCSCSGHCCRACWDGATAPSPCTPLACCHWGERVNHSPSHDLAAPTGFSRKVGSDSQSFHNDFAYRIFGSSFSQTMDVGQARRWNLVRCVNGGSVTVQCGRLSGFPGKHTPGLVRLLLRARVPCHLR